MGHQKGLLSVSISREVIRGKGTKKVPWDYNVNLPIKIQFIDSQLKFNIVLAAVLDTKIYCTFAPKIKKPSKGSPELPSQSRITGHTLLQGLLLCQKMGLISNTKLGTPEGQESDPIYFSTLRPNSVMHITDDNTAC